MPKSGLSGSVRGAPSNGRPYRDTLSKPRKGRCAGRPDNVIGEGCYGWVRRAKTTPSRCTGVVAAARTQGKRAQHGKPQSAVRDDRPDTREGQAGRSRGGGEACSTAESG